MLSPRYGHLAKLRNATTPEQCRNKREFHQPDFPQRRGQAADVSHHTPVVAAIAVTDNEDETMTYCYPCKRSFASPAALRQHLKTTSAHPYCAPCDAGFQTDGGYLSVRKSSQLSLLCVF
jgi:hypothetical protein